MTRAARRDANEPEIVKALRAVPGVSVRFWGTDGAPDLVVGFRGRNYLFEVKDPAKPRSRRQLNSRQVRWHAGWSGQVQKIETAEEALGVILAAPAGGGQG